MRRMDVTLRKCRSKHDGIWAQNTLNAWWWYRKHGILVSIEDMSETCLKELVDLLWICVLEVFNKNGSCTLHEVWHVCSRQLP